MDMKHKTILGQSSELLSRLNLADKSCFTIEDAYQIMKKSNNDAVRKLLSDLVKRGLLMRLKKGVYYTIPYEREPDTFMPNWHIIAAHLANGINYYIGYYSALEIHSLITQPSLQEQIIVDKQVKPSIIKIKDIQFRFIFHNQKHFFGAKNVWIDDFNQVKCSDFEKTIIDCLYNPHYAGGIVERIYGPGSVYGQCDIYGLGGVRGIGVFNRNCAGIGPGGKSRSIHRNSNESRVAPGCGRAIQPVCTITDCPV